MLSTAIGGEAFAAARTAGYGLAASSLAASGAGVITTEASEIGGQIGEMRYGERKWGDLDYGKIAKVGAKSAVTGFVGAVVGGKLTELVGAGFAKFAGPMLAKMGINLTSVGMRWLRNMGATWLTAASSSPFSTTASVLMDKAMGEKTVTSWGDFFDLVMQDMKTSVEMATFLHLAAASLQEEVGGATVPAAQAPGGKQGGTLAPPAGSAPTKISPAVATRADAPLPTPASVTPVPRPTMAGEHSPTQSVASDRGLGGALPKPAGGELARPAPSGSAGPSPTGEPPGPQFPHDFNVPDDFNFTAEGPLVAIPVSPTGAPARVLEVGAGPIDTNLGLPVEPGQGNQARHDASLVEVRRTDVRARPGAVELNAEQPIPPEFWGQDAVIINNPRGYRVDIANIGQAVRPGGRIVIQGRAEVTPGMREINPDMNPILQQVLKGDLPPGYRVVDVNVFPDVRGGDLTMVRKPATIMGGPFQRTQGGPVGWPNTQIVVERIVPANEPVARPSGRGGDGSGGGSGGGFGSTYTPHGEEGVGTGASGRISPVDRGRGARITSGPVAQVARVLQVARGRRVAQGADQQHNKPRQAGGART